MVALPSYRSGLYLLEPRILKSDRDNGPGADITAHVTAASVDADIDRAGAKGRLQLETIDPSLVPVNAWIAPHQRVVPEIGDIIDAQMGLYQLGDPEITYDGTGQAVASTSGVDLVDLLDRTVMTYSQTTSAGPTLSTNVMESARLAIQLATVTRSANILPNNSFEQEATGWTLAAGSGFTGTVSVSTNRAGDYIQGTRALVIRTGASPVADTFGYAASDPVEIPPGTEQLSLHWGEMADHASVQSSVTLRFYDAAGNALPTATMIGSLATAPVPYLNQWIMRFIWGEVPEGAASVRVYLLTYDRGPVATNRTMRFDALTLSTMIGTPFSRIALPMDGRAASTSIVHPWGTRWLARVNDLLAAIGYHAVYATLDGWLTSRPLRDPRTDTPSRIFTFGADSRLVENIRVRRTTGNIFNKIVAVKEDHQTGTALVAEAPNTDPDHPWSIPNRGEIGKTITVSDAVDQAALQSLANAELARASMQEELAIAVVPDPTLSVHDVIEMAGTDEAAAGRWAVESISWGLTADDPLVTIGARRTITGKDLS